MLFNSFEFLLFFPSVCIIFYALRRAKYQNIFLLLASYYFYMNWKPVYAVLILTSTAITYGCGLFVEKYQGNKRKQKAFLVTSLVINLAILFVFKYFNFINESLFNVLELLGVRWTVPNLDILLPVGISFYTFQALGYSIDVYRGTIKAEKNFFTYALFVSFFPQLVAGPIERAKNLLPQFHEEHPFNYDNAVEGCKMMLWGYFMKLCVADRLAEYVDAVYNNVAQHNGNSLILATVFFTFQIYCDFGGYSLIARGAAKVMGFNLMENFHRPYLALSIKEFWKRWHISLSTWFMDYVYIPLGGNRVRYARHLTNLMITFLVSGIWHGANWTFVLWGLWHGVFICLDNLYRHYFGKMKQNKPIAKLISIAVVFLIACFGWIFFRANTVDDAFNIISKIFTEHSGIFINNRSLMVFSFMSLFILIAKDIKDEYSLKFNFMHSKYCIVRYISYIALVFYILLYGVYNGGQFIYFQF
ncbi:MAG: MBOAT family protein [Bacteroidales bacterium]|nr:MBOAT family protein [Bacteroidales bacterium]